MRTSAKVALCVVLVTCMPGCVFWFHEYAELVGPLRAYDDEYRVRLQKVDHRMTFHFHAGAFGNTVSSVDIRLPYEPKGIATYQAEEVKVESHDDPELAQQFTSGEVVVDMQRKRVSIESQVAPGPSPLNGSYALHRH